MQYYPPFAFRVTVTSIVLGGMCLIAPFLGLTAKTLLVSLTALTFLLDSLDCYVFRVLFDPSHRPTYDYQRFDKVADLYAYLLILALFSGPLALAHPHALVALWAFFAWRSIGVYRFFNLNDNAILKLHFDALNSTLIACCLATTMPVFRERSRLLRRESAPEGLGRAQGGQLP